MTTHMAAQSVVKSKSLRWFFRSGSAIVFAAVLLLVGCASNPTVPLPPPDATVITSTSPDDEGFITVTGEPEAAEPDSVVLLFNESTESGVMETAADDGSFAAMIAAEVGHTVSIQCKLDDELSRTVYITVR